MVRLGSEMTINVIIERRKLVGHRWGVGFKICHRKAIHATDKWNAIQEREEDPTGICMGKTASVGIGVDARSAVACDGCGQDSIIVREFIVEIGGVSRETGQPI